MAPLLQQGSALHVNGQTRCMGMNTMEGGRRSDSFQRLLPYLLPVTGGLNIDYYRRVSQGKATNYGGGLYLHMQ